ncbi:MAG: hypothetical protein HC822_05635 [Oscillochloris sp.]|nr:hypothetical protein [Oscillochloris sp.]
MTDEPQISERERDILRLVATGATNQQIANDLNISVNTVKVHLRNIFGKIGVVSRTEATLYAVRAGLIEVDRERRDAPGAVGDFSATVGVAPDIREESAQSLAAPIKSPPEIDPPHAEIPTSQATRSSVPHQAEGSPIQLAAPPTPAEPRTGQLPEQPAVTPTIAAPSPQTGHRPLFLAIGVLILVVLGLGGMLLMRPAAPPPAPPADLPAANERWRELTPLPAPRSNFALTGFRFDGSNYFYVIGGEGENSIHSDVLRYDPAGNVWVSFRAKPTSVADAQATVVGGRIYVPGGRTGEGEITDVLEVYDPQRDTWEQAAALPEPRSRYGLSAAEGKIYLFGGWDGTTYQANVWQYNPDSNEWIVLPPMEAPRADMGAVTVDGLIYVLGGRDDSGELTINQRYNPAEEGIDNPWTLRAPLPIARSNVAFSSVSTDRIFVIGGDDGSPALSYNATLDVWQTIDDLPLNTGLNGLRSQASGGEVFIFGGRTDSEPLRQAFAYIAIYTTLVPPLN